ncbi:MAG TPA: ATP-dependent Clp protease proteolytic subunit [Pyrinomonadaceae bacterium]|nr:ATP-dependent Clp protease proteolytic subunit [Pyrinomonadaceae bacterium]
MASIKQIMDETQAWAIAHPGLNPHDGLRKQKIDALKALTRRPLLIYAVDFLNPKLPPQLASQMSSINLGDKDYFSDLTDNVSGNEIDLLIHSPGGSAEATEGIVTHLRSKFDNIRMLIPGTAKSAATMLAMAGNQLVMDDLSELGPTDPQMVINGRFSPAGAILKQFQKAENDLKADPAKIAAWLPVLQHYGPSILIECQNHIDLSERLVRTWLADYMFSGQAGADSHATEIARWLSHDENHLSHSRRIGVSDLQQRGLNVLDMGTDAALREAIRQLHLSIMNTFGGTGAFKLFENSEGVLLSQGITVQAVAAPTPVGAPTAPTP